MSRKNSIVSQNYNFIFACLFLKENLFTLLFFILSIFLLQPSFHNKCFFLFFLSFSICSLSSAFSIICSYSNFLTLTPFSSPFYISIGLASRPFLCLTGAEQAERDISHFQTTPFLNVAIMSPVIQSIL